MGSQVTETCAVENEMGNTIFLIAMWASFAWDLSRVNMFIPRLKGAIHWSAEQP
jgi:hypothetical protein